MSKAFIIILVVIALIGLSAWFSPCRKGMMSANGGMMGGKGKMCCQTQGKGPMEPMSGPGMGERMNREVLASPDGGLFVISGNRIIKYNKDLDVVKEFEIDGNRNMMPQGRMGMKKGCPMMQGGIQPEGFGKPLATSGKK